MSKHNRNTRPNERKLIESYACEVNGSIKTLGACCLCGRSLHRSHLNKTGVRCYYEGAQYDQDGKYLFDARTERLYKATRKAERFSTGNSETQAVIDKLIEAAKEVCAQ